MLLFQLTSFVFIPKMLSLFQALDLGCEKEVERKKREEGFGDVLRCFYGDKMHLGANLRVLSIYPRVFFYKW